MTFDLSKVFKIIDRWNDKKYKKLESHFAESNKCGIHYDAALAERVINEKRKLNEKH